MTSSTLKLSTVILFILISVFLLKPTNLQGNEILQSLMDIDEVIYQKNKIFFCEMTIVKYSRLRSEDDFKTGAPLSDLAGRTPGDELAILHIGLDAKACITDRKLRRDYVESTNNPNNLIYLALQKSTIIMVNTEHKIAYFMRGGW